LVLLAFGLWILLQGLQQVVWLIVLVLTAVVFALGVSPIVGWVHQLSLPPRGWHLPKALVAVVVYVFVLGGIGLALVFTVGVLTTEIGGLMQAVPREAEPIRGLLETVEAFLAGEAVEPPWLAQDEGFVGLIQSALGILSEVAGGIFQFALIIILSILLIAEGERGFNYFVSLLAPSQQEEARKLGGGIARRVGRWVMGELALMLAVGVLTTAGLLLIGVPFALLLGITAALLELAPFVGPTLVAIPAALLGFTVSPTMGIVAGVFMIALAQFDAHVLTPLLLGQAVKISPVLVIIAIVAGAAWFGILGALIAVPLAASLQLVFRELVEPYVRARTQPGAIGARKEQGRREAA
jgi:predicted PurR-regulated permease PerM